jgi:hypothetical protein
VKLSNYTKYSKFIVAALGAVGTALSTQYPGNHWTDAIIATITAVTVWLVPNTTPAPAQPVAIGWHSGNPNQ